MQIQLSRAHFVYEVALRAPAFEIALSGAKNVQALYSIFVRKFKIAPNNIQVINQANLGEYINRLVLLDGLWTLDFRFDRYVFTCSSLQTGSDVSLAIESLDLVEEAATSIFGEAPRTAAQVSFSGWYWCEGGADAAQGHIAGLARNELKMAPGFCGAEEVNFVINGTIMNSKETWSNKFLLEPSVVEYGHLFVQSQGRYIEGGKFDSLAARRQHFVEAYTAILKQAGLHFGSVEPKG